jgi:uncharacterized membrane protein YkoI
MFIGAGAVGILAVALFFILAVDAKTDVAGYHPIIKPGAFSATVNNPYFTLVPGTQFIYEAKKSEGIERIEITVLPETRMVMGVETRIVRDTVYLDGSLIEDTLDWYAQDTEGNVWYFGEDTAEYENGVITSRHGAWEAGVHGALPGIVMKAQPKIDDSYYQEYYAGEAEDRADVLAVNETVDVPHGTFNGCVKTFDYTALDPKSLEHKYYCKETGFTALEVDVTDGERTELVSVETGVIGVSATLTPSVSGKALPSPATSGSGAGMNGGGTASAALITEVEAKAIALKTVPGKVTAIEVALRGGMSVYVVEVDADTGSETDVIIDKETGSVLDVEI